MMILSYFMYGLLSIVCIFSTYTDIKWGKIYNRYLIWTFILSSVFVIFYYIQNNEFLVSFIINLVGAAFISFLFFLFKIWGAGDSKLWIMICFIFPYGDYITKDYLLFPSLYILFFIFLIAYFYVLGETFVLMICKLIKNRPTKERYILKQRKLEERKKIFFDCIFSFFLIKIFYCICSLIFKEYYSGNYFFFILLGLLLTIMVLKTDVKKVYKSLVILVGSTLFLINLIKSAESRIDPAKDFIIIFVSVTFIFIRKGLAKYNYQEVLVKDLKKGMILSVSTIIDLNKSKVKGLPQITDESTKYRITQEEVNAIQKWEKSKKGKNSIIIVKYLPFAIFMSLGIIVYRIWRYSLYE